MAVTQKDIAKRAGISASLVSRVLGGKARDIGISEEMVEKVRQIADELGYVRSSAALSLRGESTKTIGVVVYDFSDPFFGDTIAYLQEIAHSLDYSLVLAGFINRQPDKRDLQPLLKNQLDGIIIIGSGQGIEWLENFNVPVVRIGHGAANEQSVRIIPDEVDAAKTLMEHLSGAKHHDVLVISDGAFQHASRIENCVEAAAQNRLSLSVKIQSSSSPFMAGYDAVVKLIEANGKLPDVLICANDRIAMGAASAVCESGRTVPDDIAVCGYDDISAAAQFYPPLTTIRHPLKRSAELAIDAVINKRENGVLTLPSTLICRRSC